MSRIRVLVDRQRLELHDDDGRLIERYSVSTAARGAGENNGSFQTPRGHHIVRAKIGAGAPPYSRLRQTTPHRGDLHAGVGREVPAA